MNTIQSEWEKLCGGSGAFTDQERQIFYAGAIALRALLDEMTKAPVDARKHFLAIIDQELDGFAREHLQ